MKMRTLGALGTPVSPIMLGGNVFGWTIDQEQSFAVLDHFADRGFNFIDTADMYSSWVPGNKGGESETILGNWLKRTGKRESIVLATKLGNPMGEGKKGLSAKYMRAAVEASLRRLQTDYIDLYQAHIDDAEAPLEETLRAFNDLVQEGKVRTIGASNYDGRRLRAAEEVARNAGWQRYETLQPNYNLHTRQEYERDLAPVAAEFNIGVVPYFSLASGFLTGKYKTAADAEGARRSGMLGKYFDDRGLKILAALDSVSKHTGAKPASIALAWLLSRPNILAPIASATSIDQMDDLFAAADLELSAEQLSELSLASAYDTAEADPAMVGALPVEA
ncbi:aldo/keto reductase [Terriglobus roseus]|uniref:Predicted oxidoreductase n=1 Tax=Terriglobus roseus TaxID=392734 RepID=A0A1H4LY99_9BACT|nr:aldo/keto reductase [Terriglobus roseus]SEB75749.1 Predicted oxidoreductase [Terriglobus roseus]